jgi:mono/diheme cytochrome c family protein
MKRAVTVIMAFAALMLMTMVAQAESKGEQLFNQKCAMCHVVKGKGGAIGPELTKVASRMTEGALKVQLENPKSKNASSTMPSFKTLSKPDMDALLGYLKTLK